MSEENRSPSEEMRAKLDERGIEWWNETDPVPQRTTVAEVGDELVIYHENANGTVGYSRHNMHGMTPEQAIAATVGNGTDLSKRLREVHGLHEFAELFGFDWRDESDWSWHDVACAMADAIDATAGVGTCEGSFHESSDLSSGRVPLYFCKGTNKSIFMEREAKVCPLCGGRIKEEAE